jgi:hypothetical protein
MDHAFVDSGVRIQSDRMGRRTVRQKAYLLEEISLNNLWL